MHVFGLALRLSESDLGIALKCMFSAQLHLSHDIDYNVIIMTAN